MLPRLKPERRKVLLEAARAIVPSERADAVVDAVEAAWRALGARDDDVALAWILVGVTNAERQPEPARTVALRVVPSVSSVA
jgi:hypothetical protein